MSEPEIKVITLDCDTGPTGLLDAEEEHALYSDPLMEDEEGDFGEEHTLLAELTAVTAATVAAEATATATATVTATTIDISGVDVPEPIAEPPVPVVMPSPDMNTKGVVGLQNMGNTCYANSTLQILRAVPEWNVFCMREDLETACTNKESINAKLIMGYQDLIQSMWSAHRPAYVRPMGFLNVIKDSVRGTVYENFGRPQQNDSHEYLVYLLDNFHEALNENANSKDVVEPAPKDASMAVQAEVGWRTFLSRHTSPVIDMFFGMNRVTVECDTCHNKSYRWETFNVYKIPLEGATLQDWFRAENAPSTIDEYECESCRISYDKRQPAKKYGHIWRLPQSLFVALRRFDYNGRKNMTACPPISGLVSLAEHFAPESDHPSKSWQFECRAIADHHGGLHGGHYSAQMAHPVTNQWWWIDDSMSQPLPAGPRFGSANYVVYLRRKTDCVAHEA
jgi:ubiquitin C-terminal hydrolase